MPVSDPHEKEASTGLREQLRELATQLEPPFDWVELEHRAQRRLAQARARGVLRGIAASGALVLLVVAAWHELDARRPVSPLASQPSTPSPAVRVSEAPPSDLPPDLQRWLVTPPDPHAIVHVGTRLAVADLQDRIVTMDAMLNEARLARLSPPQLEAIQAQRASLVDSLVWVRYADTLASEVPR